MKLLFIGLVLLYLVVGTQLFNYWLAAFQRDKGLDEEDIFISKVVLGVATLFWPLVLPFSYLELSKSRNRKRKQTEIYTNSSQSSDPLTDFTVSSLVQKDINP